MLQGAAVPPVEALARGRTLSLLAETEPLKKPPEDAYEASQSSDGNQVD